MNLWCHGIPGNQLFMQFNKFLVEVSKLSACLSACLFVYVHARLYLSVSPSLFFLFFFFNMYIGNKVVNLEQQTGSLLAESANPG